MAMYAGVELGGTKCICILGSGPGEVIARELLPTQEPGMTLNAIGAVLQRWNSPAAPLTAIGIASFGPLDLRHGSPTHGRIGPTTKHNWAYTDLGAYFRQRFGFRGGEFPVAERLAARSMALPFFTSASTSAIATHNRVAPSGKRSATESWSRSRESSLSIEHHSR